MPIDLRTISIKPVRSTFDHIARRFGDKPASRYQEGTYDLQAVENFHYRPTWDPDREEFDPRRTAISMQDWYAFKDPRQFYYGSWTINRSRMQDAADAKFRMVEERGLSDLMPAEVRDTALDVLVPLRHLAWGGNMNNTFICTYGFGAAITQCAMYQAMDYLGIAQYLTRMGLVLDGPQALDTAKAAWLDAPMWQPLRKYVEDSFVVHDWFELFVAQNFVLDGLVTPLLFDRLDAKLNSEGGAAVSMMTRFVLEWSVDATKWVNAQIKTAVAESAENAATITAWTLSYRKIMADSLAPLAERAFRADGANQLAGALADFDARATKLGLNLGGN